MVNFNKLTSVAFVAIRKISSIHIDRAAVTFLLFGAAIAVAGVWVEENHELTLLQTGGQDALAAYLGVLQSAPIESLWQFLSLGVHGQLPSAGGNIQAVGYTICYIGGIVACLAIATARIIVHAVDASTTPAQQS